MKKTIVKERIDYDKNLIKITISEDMVYDFDPLSDRKSLINLLNSIVNDPTLVEYNGLRPSKIELFSNEGRWFIICFITETIKQ